MRESAFELQVMVSGRPVREFGHQGQTYVEGRLGSAFTLKFRNNSSDRILAIPSVNGLSIVDGQPANADSRGYVVPGLSSVEFKGWRESLERSADFLFTTKDKDYAAQTHGDENIGVIGVKVVAEKPKPVVYHVAPPIEHHHHHHHYPEKKVFYPSPWQPYWGTTTCMSSPTETVAFSAETGQLTADSSTVKSASGSVDFNLGVGWGDSKEDRVGETSFERGTELATLLIYYSDAAGLAAAGIVLNKDLAVEARSLPRAFGGFCSPPRRIA